MGPNQLMHPAFAMIPRTHQRILWLIKTRGAVPAETIAESVEISTSGVRQHLKSLEAEGLLAYTEVREGPGRPLQMWKLTAAAEAFFPSGYAQFTNDLLDGLAEEDPALLGRLIERRAQRRFEQLKPLFNGLGFEEKVHRLASLLDQDGFLVSVETKPDGSFVLVEQNCAMLSVARKHGEVCSSELQLLQRLLPEAQVQRVKYMIDGQTSCAYLIERAPQQSAA